MSELFRALAALAEPPNETTPRLAGALSLGPPPRDDEYTEIFLFQLYPYASVYLGAEGMRGGEARDRVAGFWRALGRVPPNEPDHLAVMLALYARLREFEEGEPDEQRRGGWRHARRAFLWEHLLSWLPVYLSKLKDLSQPDEDDPRFYARWAELLARALDEEAGALGPQGTLPAHLREAPPLADPRRAGTDEFLRTLLAPARAGFVLTRADLRRAARRLELNTRPGERHFVLKSLFAQDAAGLLGWLKREADSAAEQHRARRPALGAVAEAWETRAAASAALLSELRQTAGEAGAEGSD
ncbi:MAG TPA: molecular chaperone TorD family protein [Pyrinomonadaceae bacterium]|nr:molecular chaperone TorD family protein [Pyrinomonadaceae bacterium]